jgi:hypothetical protein
MSSTSWSSLVKQVSQPDDALRVSVSGEFRFHVFREGLIVEDQHFACEVHFYTSCFAGHSCSQQTSISEWFYCSLWRELYPEPLAVGRQTLPGYRLRDSDMLLQLAQGIAARPEDVTFLNVCLIGDPSFTRAFKELVYDCRRENRHAQRT